MRTSLASLIIVLFTPELSFCENPPFSPNHTVQTHLSSFPLPPARCRAHTAFTAYLLLVKAQTSSGELSSVCLIYVTTTAPQQVFPLTDLPTLPTSKTACRASLCPPEANIFVSFLLPVTELFTATFWELIPPFCPQNKCCDQVQQHEFPTKMKALHSVWQGTTCPNRFLKNALLSVFLETQVFDHCNQTRWLAFTH